MKRKEREMDHLKRKSKIGGEINLESPWKPWIDKDKGWLRSRRVKERVQEGFGRHEGNLR